MSDQQELCCSDLTCGEVKKKNDNGAYHKFCPECNEPVPDISKSEPVKCPNCDEELMKNRSGFCPQNFPECDKPANPLEALKPDVLKCSNSECNEEIKRNKKGEYVKYCIECDEPVLPQKLKPEAPECPDCGEKRAKSARSGKLAKRCSECGYSYTSNSIAGGSITESVHGQSAGDASQDMTQSWCLIQRESLNPDLPVDTHQGHKRSLQTEQDCEAMAIKSQEVFPDQDLQTRPGASHVLYQPRASTNPHNVATAHEPRMSAADPHNADSMHKLGGPGTGLDNFNNTYPPTGNGDEISGLRVLEESEGGGEGVTEDSQYPPSEMTSEHVTAATGDATNIPRNNSNKTYPRDISSGPNLSQSQYEHGKSGHQDNINKNKIFSLEDRYGAQAVDSSMELSFGMYSVNSQNSANNITPGSAMYASGDGEENRQQSLEQQDPTDDALRPQHSSGDDDVADKVPVQGMPSTQTGAPGDSILGVKSWPDLTKTSTPEQGDGSTTQSQLTGGRSGSVEPDSLQYADETGSVLQPASEGTSGSQTYTDHQGETGQRQSPHNSEHHSENQQGNNLEKTESLNQHERHQLDKLTSIVEPSPKVEEEGIQGGSVKAVHESTDAGAGDGANENEDGRTETHSQMDKPIMPGMQCSGPLPAEQSAFGLDSKTEDGPPSSSTRSKTADGTDNTDNTETVDSQHGNTIRGSRPVPEKTLAELDVVATFMDMRSKINHANRALQDKLEKRLTNQEGELLHKLLAHSNQKCTQYEENKNSQQNQESDTRSMALEESENGLRKFFNKYSRELNPILLKLGIEQLLTLELASKARNKAPHTTQKNTKGSIKVTFKMVLANMITKHFEEQKINPIVEIFSDVDGYERPLLALQRNHDGIWVGTWSAHGMSGRTIQYKYFIHDGFNFHEDGYEWLGETGNPKKPINRYLRLSGDEKEVIVYDGIVQPKSESSRFARFISYVRGMKQQEQERGIRAMLPNWTEEIQKGSSIQCLVNWILQVLNRQTECLSRFMSYTRDTDYNRSNTAKQIVDIVFTAYILQSFNDHKLLANSPDACSSFASLAGLLHIASQRHSEQSPLEKHVHLVPQLLKATMKNELGYSAIQGKEVFTEHLLTKLQGDGKFVKYVL